jgi:hypothetical protein
VIEDKYRAWKTRNPGVLDLFETYATEMLARGRRFGIGQLAERVRWEVRRTWDTSDGYKINNNFRALVARDLIAKHPGLKALVETRVRRAA